MSREYQFEKVTYEPSPQNNGEFLPQITIGESSHRPFHPSDMDRVLDYDNMPEPPPPDSQHGHLEFEMDDDDMTIRDDAPPKFPKRYFCLRGSFIFYYDMKDVDNSNSYDKASFDRHDHSAKFLGPPSGVIPLERTTVEFPPGGRRVFREHANTEARNGYEMMIRHVARAANISSTGAGTGAVTGMQKQEKETSAGAASAAKRRAPAYLVMDSLGQREVWADAIRFRADVYKKDTKLRPAGTNPEELNNNTGADDMMGTDIFDVLDPSKGGKKGISSPTRGETSRRVGGEISVLAGVLQKEEQKDIDEALQTFGTRTLFQEDVWVDDFFQRHSENEGADMCQKFERWQTSIKKGLRGAVLEQYEYFVEASREMTVMGREVASLKDLVNKQVGTFESMKRVTFDLDFGEGPSNGDIDADGVGTATEDGTETYSSDEEDENENTSEKSPIGKKRFGRFRGAGATSPRSKKSTSTIDIPLWLDDVVEEITAFVKECRYTDATELLLKAKSEVSDIVNSNEKLTEKTLSKKELVSMQRILISIEDLTKRLCERLSEGLRRKNEALKQTTKKEKADPLAAMAPLVSPIALNDDSTALHLLVRLGRSQDAASAYATRRSLLLNECLQERPFCNINATNNMDVVIYAAQLSHSFFNALAMSVEGFLDMFADSGKVGLRDDQSESSSIHTGTNLSNIPSNALAATCLWCDSELSKFASVFGNKILGNLLLSPRDGGVSNKITDHITKFESVADLSHLKQQLRAAEEMGEYAAAGKLRKKIAIQEEAEKGGKADLRGPSSKKSNDKDRKLAIEIASKCMDQAFSFASETLNTIGLPLTPRLAEYLRARLKGAEAEIAVELEDTWDHIIFDWKSGSVGLEIRTSTSAG